MPIDPNVPLMAFRGGGSDVPSPMQTLAQLYQLQQMQQHGHLQQQESAMRAEEFGLRKQQYEAQQAEAQRKLAGEQALDEAVKNAPVLEDGTLDMEFLRARIPGHQWPALQKTLADADTALLTRTGKKRDADMAARDERGAFAAVVKALPPEQRAAAMPLVLGTLVRRDGMPRELAVQLMQTEHDPAELESLLDQAILASPAQQKRLQAEQAEAAKQLREGQQWKPSGSPGQFYHQPAAPGGMPETFQAPQAGTPFTLTASPGGTTTRYGPDGKPIATVSAPLTPSQLHAGGTDAAVIDPTMTAEQKLWTTRALAAVRGKDQKAGTLADINLSYASGPDDYRLALRNTVINNLTVDEKNVARARGYLLRHMQALQPLVEQIPTNLVAGTSEKTLQNLGLSRDPRLANLKVQLERALQTYQRGQTGAQFSLPEAKQYKDMWPDIANSLPLNLARIRGMQASIGREDREFWDSRFGAKGADFIGGPDPDTTLRAGALPPTLGGPGLGPGTEPLQGGGGPVRRTNPFQK